MEHSVELRITERSDTTRSAVLGMRCTLWIGLRGCCNIEKEMKSLSSWLLMFCRD